MSEIRFRPAGERAVLVELGSTIDETLNERVRALDETLLDSPFPGYLEAVPAYCSILVFYEPRDITFEDVREHIARLAKGLEKVKLPPGPLKKIPAVYDGEDLEEVARLSGTTAEEVVHLHAGVEYRVFVVGFTPGFAYMGMTDEKISLPRRSTPRTRVPAGSVAIAMGQTGIYPQATPGGWHLLGRAEHRTLFDLDADPPSFFLPGDRVRFVPVEALPPYEPVRPHSAASTAMESAGSASFEVEDGGLWTTVQDLGRRGYQRYGVPVAGAVDPLALRAANALVGNDEGAAALECTANGPRLHCLRPAIAAVTGADLGAVVERSDLGRWHPPPWSAFRLRPGNVLSFEGRRSGARAYASFRGGVDVPLVLGSRSTYQTAGFGGYEGRALRAGDRLVLGEAKDVTASLGSASPPAPPDDDALRVVWGPQDHDFTAEARASLTSSTYTVGASSDRMGYRLEGPVLEHRDRKEIVSDGMMLGGIQVPPNGLPIVMLADCATTGGYPKIATLVTKDVPRLAQLIPGEPVRFRAVSLDEARAIYLEEDGATTV